MRSPVRAAMGTMIACLLHGSVSQASAASIVASVEGYQVLDTEKPTDPRPCQMVRSYPDPKQQGSGKGLFFSQLEGGNIVVTVVYTRWSWIKGSPPKTRFQIDGQNYAPLTVWFSEASSLGALFADTLIAKLGQGRRIVIGLPNANVDFDLSGFRPAFEALQRCNRAARPAAPLPQAATPPQEAAPAPAPDPGQTPAASPATTEELRAMAYFAGVMLQDGVERCDVATTTRQRAAISEKVAALRSEMQDLEAAARDKAAGQRCPEAGDRQALEILQSFIAEAPERFAADWNEKNGGSILTEVRATLAELRPAGSAHGKEPAHETAYLYGLVVRDVIRECDIRTTAKQRTSFEAKMASLRTEVSAAEPALVEKKGAFASCPSTERIAEMEKALPVFIERTPEAFAAEMERLTKGKAID